jgi:hypothetical protein
MAAFALGQLLGCAPQPAPGPTPTPSFASEEEAFAAAEEVYRAYNDAGNARRGEANADPQQFLTGAALEGDIDTQNILQSRSLFPVGAAAIDSIRGEASDLASNVATITMVVCLDVSAVSLLNDAGVDVTPSERGDMVAQEVILMGDTRSLLISDASTMDDYPC